MADPTDDEIKLLKAEARQKAKIEAERARMAKEREQHAKTIAAETEQAKSELEMVMGELTEGERRMARMHAYLHVLNSDWSSPENRQADVDRISLLLAKYMVLGYVR